MRGKSNCFRSGNTQRRNIRKDIPIVQGQQCTHSLKARWNVMDFCGSNPRVSMDGKAGSVPHVSLAFRSNPRVSVDGKACKRGDKTERGKQIESEKNMDKMVVSSARVYIDELISPVTEWKDFSKIFN